MVEIETISIESVYENTVALQFANQDGALSALDKRLLSDTNSMSIEWSIE